MTGFRPANVRSRGIPPFLIAVLAIGSLAWIATRPPHREAAAPVSPTPPAPSPAPAPANTDTKKPEPESPRDLAGARDLVEMGRQALERGDLGAARAAADRARQVSGESFPELEEFANRLAYHEEMRAKGGEARAAAEAAGAEGRLQGAIDTLKHHLFTFPLTPDRPEIEALIERLETERKGRFDVDMKKLQIIGESGSIERVRALAKEIAVYASREEIQAAQDWVRGMEEAAVAKAGPKIEPAKAEPPPPEKGTPTQKPAPPEKPPPEQVKTPEGKKPAENRDAQALAREIRQYLTSVSQANLQRFRDRDLDARITLIPDAFAERMAREALAALDAGARPDELPARLAKIRKDAANLRGVPAVEIRILAPKDKGIFISPKIEDHIALRQTAHVSSRIEWLGPAPAYAEWEIVDRPIGKGVTVRKQRLAWLEDGLAVRVTPRAAIRRTVFLEAVGQDIILVPRTAPGVRGFLADMRRIPAESASKLPGARAVFESALLISTPEPPPSLRALIASD